MVYVALLRGINVGGNNKIDMKTLKRVFEEAGMSAVKTYINSGNIIFTDASRTKNDITTILESAIFAHFALQIKVLVYNFDEFSKIAESIPVKWTNDTAMKSDVLFLWEEVDSESVMEKLFIKPEIDAVHYVPGAILWSVDREKVTRSGMSKIIGTPLYKLVTIRNVNTVRKLYGMMKTE
ncbi:DUF1697 domain-containing protein [Planomicrobium sp. CPCC 101079]|uniref:DUF1697 domain-containing protein n=1 Tax=Planomicrobium sp. CPCC 101079 TaxID=2599618 RepID=UPI0011B515DC|nr:DUF1697 domain-containing protein [Planomicrobium sp. CPCC 101079]TWT01512.1 DUF1697 domain-containing protein [Planomicrobium sp. CPCC 101079]